MTADHEIATDDAIKLTDADEIANTAQLATIVIAFDCDGRRLGVVAVCACRWRSDLEEFSRDAVARLDYHLTGGHLG